jgi:hypothetical protein
MPHVPYNPDDIDWNEYFAEMCAQNGGGKGPYFLDPHYQRGAGIGSIFARLIRFLTPIAKAAGREIGREGLAVGSRILSGVSEGRSLKKVAIDEIAEGARNLARRNDLSAGIQKYVDERHRRLQKGKGMQRHLLRKKPLLHGSRKANRSFII